MRNVKVLAPRPVITRREDYLHIEFTGEFSVVAAHRTIDLMLSACAEHKCSRVLMDCRKMTGHMPLMDRFEVAVYAGTTIGPGPRIALLGRPDQVLTGNYFVESVARLRGVDVREFFKEEKALEWLMT